MTNFHPLEVVGRATKTQPQVGENLNMIIKWENSLNIFYLLCATYQRLPCLPYVSSKWLTLSVQNCKNIASFSVTKEDTVDLVRFARFQFSRISRGQIRKFKNLAKIIILIALLKKNGNS